MEVLRLVRQCSQGLLVTRCADIQYLFLIAMMNLAVIYTGVYFVQLVSVCFGHSSCFWVAIVVNRSFLDTFFQWNVSKLESASRSIHFLSDVFAVMRRALRTVLDGRLNTRVRVVVLLWCIRKRIRRTARGHKREQHTQGQHTEKNHRKQRVGGTKGHSWRIV